MPIAYNEYGKGHKNHVLFIHGLGASSLSWKDIPAALSNYFHTINVDLIGFGESEKPAEADYTVKGLSKFIFDFITKEIKISENERISIVGHSLGGYIAAQVAIENKNMIDKLVLIDPSGLLENPTDLLKEYCEAALETEPVLRYKKLKKVLSALYADPSWMPPVVVNAFVKTIIKEGARPAFEQAYNNSTTTQIKLEGFKQLQDIPCLVLWGEKDNLMKRIPYYDKFKAMLPPVPKAKYEIIDNAGHAPFVEYTALVFEKIHTFLANDQNNDML
jgi:pimeloyl-ACP methyl ester carboxylesterase